MTVLRRMDWLEKSVVIFFSLLLGYAAFVYVRGLIRERSGDTRNVHVARMKGDIYKGLRAIPWDQGETEICAAVRFNDNVLLNCGTDTFVAWDALQRDLKTAGDKATAAAMLQSEIYLRARMYAVTFKGPKAAAGGDIAGGSDAAHWNLWSCTKAPDGFSCD